MKCESLALNSLLKNALFCELRDGRESHRQNQSCLDFLIDVGGLSHRSLFSGAWSPEPTKAEKRRVWQYFQNLCAYCGEAIEDGNGDTDHLVSATSGGANGLANRVLSCKPCNAEEKRDREWILFLREKSPSEEIFQERKARIENWIRVNGGRLEIDQRVLAVLNVEAKRVTKEYEVACSRIRSVRNTHRI